jgi:hypothetical protein
VRHRPLICSFPSSRWTGFEPRRSGRWRGRPTWTRSWPSCGCARRSSSPWPHSQLLFW